MPTTGADIIARNIIKYRQGFLNAVNETMVSVKEILDQQITLNMSLQDHSLSELKKLGHPYSSRYGVRGAGLHEPYWQVHSQGGQLLSSKKSGLVKADVEAGQLKASAFVKLDPEIAKHALFVVYGTSKMIPRPILTGSRDQVFDAMNLIIKTRLKNLHFLF